jgi:hypothetical protein
MQDAESNWQFDIFAYAEATPGNSLSMLTFHLLKSTGLVQEFDLNEVKLTACLRKIESGYDPANPYHNRSAMSRQHGRCGITFTFAYQTPGACCVTLPVSGSGITSGNKDCWVLSGWSVGC